ncbi:uncharacterized protein LOC121261388 isoform X1 [Juglans microcarpa x Juglans regia]|uniref:uncharacterized protein LOC121261388 isoform X1 n=1 Tax=Juglans microcarpa x Juglans regia TaxID=2249226 RepID=UPI001B7E4A76|nr:uncharacterized protein LOC121261388 isoform X1 [Juglans microcarpa x Juglans regia]
MESPKHKTLILQSALFFSLFILSVLHAPAQTLPPARVDGFVYKNTTVDSDTIIIEAFYDPVCPDSRDSWPPLKQALRYYGSRAWLVVHLFPLPYHDNAFVASRALHIVNSLNDSATFPLLEHFFKYQQGKFYNAQTRNLSRAHVVSEIVKFTTEVVGNSYYSAVKSGFNDTKTDLKTRVSFKYGASRGVYGTPFFYVNGFLLADAGSAIDFSGWKNIIDPLIRAHGVKSEDTLHFFL